MIAIGLFTLANDIANFESFGTIEWVDGTTTGRRTLTIIPTHFMEMFVISVWYNFHDAKSKENGEWYNFTIEQKNSTFDQTCKQEFIS